LPSPRPSTTTPVTTAAARTVPAATRARALARDRPLPGGRRGGGRPGRLSGGAAVLGPGRAVPPAPQVGGRRIGVPAGRRSRAHPGTVGRGRGPCRRDSGGFRTRIPERTGGSP